MLPRVPEPGAQLRSARAALAKVREREPALDVLLQLIGRDGQPAASASDGLAQGPALDEARFIALVRAHTLAPFVARALQREPVPRISGAARAEVVALFRESAAESLGMAPQLVRVLEILRRAGVDALAFKGPVLALQAYGELAARTFLDLDLLVRPEHGDKACAALRAAGFVPDGRVPEWAEAELLRTRGERTLWHEPWDLTVDLHTALVEAGYSFAPPPELAFAAPTSVQLGGHTIATLEPELLWVWQCLHGAKHNFAQLSHVIDLARLLVHARLDPDRILDLSRKVGSRRMLALGLALVALVGRVTLPPQLARELDEAGGVVDFALTRAIERWSDPLSGQSTRRPIDDVWLATFERPADVARYVTRLVARPTAHEYALLPLPRAARGLYLPLRLGRLSIRALARLARYPPPS